MCLAVESTQKCVSETVKSRDKNASEGLFDYCLKQQYPALLCLAAKGPMLLEANFLYQLRRGHGNNL